MTNPPPGPSRRVTIQDVARSAGVSVSAVSKVVRDAYGVSPQMRSRVTAAIDAEAHQRAAEALIDRQADGLILIAPFTSHDWLEGLGSRVPVVVVGRHGPSTNYDTVSGDDIEGARLVVDHLVALGHRRITFIAHPSMGVERPFVMSHTAREDGYGAAMGRHGIDPEVIVTSWTEQGGYQAAIEALDRSVPPTAIFAGADIAALGVLRAAEER